MRWNLHDGRSTVYPVTGAMITAAGSGWILVGTLDAFEGRIAAVSPDGIAYALPAPERTLGAVFGRWQITYMHVLRTREFKNQPEYNRFGSITISRTF